MGVSHDAFNVYQWTGRATRCVVADLDLQRLRVRIVLEDELLEVEEGPLVVHALPDLWLLFCVLWWNGDRMLVSH